MKLSILLTSLLAAGTLLRAGTITSRKLVFDGFPTDGDGVITGPAVNGSGFVTVDYDSTPGATTPILALTINYDGNTFDLTNVRHDPAVPSNYFPGWPVWGSSSPFGDLYAAWGEKNPVPNGNVIDGVQGAPALIVEGDYFRFSPDGFIDVGPEQVRQYELPYLAAAYDGLLGTTPVYSGSVQYTPEPAFAFLLGLVPLAGLGASKRARQAKQ